MAGAVRLLAPVAAMILFLGLNGSALAQQAQPTAAAGVAATPAATPAPTAGKGTINGTVINSTKGGGSVTGQDVNLYVYKGQNQSDKKTTKAGQDGKFSFSGLDTGADFTYLVHTQYQGADYASDPIVFPSGSTEQTTELEVFDSTSSDQNITMSARHYLLDPEPDGLYVSEIAIITNSGDKTYTGSTPVHEGLNETVRFSLPQGAQDVEYGGGMLGTRVFQDNGDLVDTWPLYPGDSQRIFRYVIPTSGGTASFVSKLTANTAKVNVLIPDEGVGITVSNLPNKSSQEIQEEKYLLFSGDNLAAGTQLQFKLDHLPMAQAAGDQGMQGSLPVIAGSGIIVAVLIASVVVMLLRRRRGSKQAVGPDVSADTAGEEPDGSSPRSARDLSAAEMEAEEEILDAEKRELVAAIARLDDDFEAQKISAEEYGRLRAEKKRRLVQVVDRQKSLAAARGDQ
jgi:hypothetical protein